MAECENCTVHGERLTKLETDSEWMKSTLDEIRESTSKMADYAGQLVTVAHETQSMSDAVSRAFKEIERLREDVTPIIRQWDGVLETSKWIKAGVVGIVAIVGISVIAIIIR